MSTGAAIRVAIGIFNYAFLMLFPGSAVFGQSSDSGNAAIIYGPGTAFKLTFAVEAWIQETTQNRYSKQDFTVHYKPASLSWIIEAIPDNHLNGRFSSEINRLQRIVREALGTESIPNGDNSARRTDYYRQVDEALESMRQIVRSVLRLHPDWFKLENARFDGSSEIQWEERRPPTAGRPNSVVRVEAEPFSLSADRTSLRFSSPGKGGIIIQARLKTLNGVIRRLQSLSSAGFDASEADRTLITRFQDLAFRFIKSLEEICPPKYRSILNGESGFYHLDFLSNIFEYLQVRWEGSWIKSFGEPTQSTTPIDQSRTLWWGIPVMDDAQPYYTLIGDDYLDPDFPKWQDGFRNILQIKVDGSGNTGVDRSAGGFVVVGSWPGSAAGKATFISISNGFKRFYRDDWKWNHRYTFSWSLEALHGVAEPEKKPPAIVVLVQSGDELKPAQTLTYGVPHVIELQYESRPSENAIDVIIAVDNVKHQIPAARTLAGEGRVFRTELFVLLPETEPASSAATGSQ
jgi:hypothetical protein